MDKYECSICGYVYNPEEGDPDNGIDPGTSLMTCPMIGPAPCVVRKKISLKRYRWYLNNA